MSRRDIKIRKLRFLKREKDLLDHIAFLNKKLTQYIATRKKFEDKLHPTAFFERAPEDLESAKIGREIVPHLLDIINRIQDFYKWIYHEGMYSQLEGSPTKTLKKGTKLLLKTTKRLEKLRELFEKKSYTPWCYDVENILGKYDGSAMGGDPLSIISHWEYYDAFGTALELLGKILGG